MLRDRLHTMANRVVTVALSTAAPVWPRRDRASARSRRQGLWRVACLHRANREAARADGSDAAAMVLRRGRGRKYLVLLGTFVLMRGLTTSSGAAAHRGRRVLRRPDRGHRHLRVFHRVRRAVAREGSPLALTKLYRGGGGAGPNRLGGRDNSDRSLFIWDT